MSNLVVQNHAELVGRVPPPYDYGSGYQEAPTSQLDQFGLHDLLRIIHRYRVLMMVVVAVATIGTLAWQLTSPTLYRSYSSAKIELIDDVGVNQAEVNARNSQRLANEVKLYYSRSAAERVVRDLALHRDPAFEADAGGTFGKDEDEAIADAAGVVMGMINISSADGSDQIEIYITSRDPEMAAKIANQFPRSVQDLKAESANDRRNKLLASLEEEQLKRKAEADESAKLLADFRREHRILVGGGGPEDLAQINRIATEAASAQAMASGSGAASAGVARAAGMRSTAGASSAAVDHLTRQEADLTAELARQSQVYGSRHPDIVRLNSQLAEVRNSLGRERQAAISAASSVAAAESARMTQLARSEAARDAARAGQLQGILAQYTSKAYANVADSVQLEGLVRNADLSGKAFQDITTRINEVRAQVKEEGVTSTLISPAVANYGPIAPEPLKMTVLAALGSSLLALLLAFTRELLDDRLRTVAQIRRLFGLPTFGMLPTLDREISRKLAESPVLADPQSLFAEVARATYVEVESLAEKAAHQSVLITSPLPGDGKSVVAVTLAAAAVAMGKRAVVLDLDLRKSGILQEMQQASNSPDLLEVLKGNIDVKQIAPPPRPAGNKVATLDEHEADASRIALLSVTKPVADPASILNSSKMAHLIEDLKERFDLVVINAPPTLAVRDARTMCEYTDHTLLVARWGVTTIDQMRATLEMLGRDRVDGVVFSQVDYAEHARRRYGDSIQYYFESSDYYSDGAAPRRTLLGQLRRMFSRAPRTRYAD